MPLSHYSGGALEQWEYVAASLGHAVGSAEDKRTWSYSLTAVVHIYKLWAFTLPTCGCFLILLSCQGHSSRSGEVHVVRE